MPAAGSAGIPSPRRSASAKARMASGLPASAAASIVSVSGVAGEVDMSEDATLPGDAAPSGRALCGGVVSRASDMGGVSGEGKGERGQIMHRMRPRGKMVRHRRPPPRPARYLDAPALSLEHLKKLDLDRLEGAIAKTSFR